jgi:transcriptional regulator with GAF, ATPase, and Fis domain
MGSEMSSSTAARSLPADGSSPSTSPAHAEGAAHPPDDLALLREVGRRHICRVMKHTRGNEAQAARVLGLWRDRLHVKLERLGILDG